MTKPMLHNGQKPQACHVALRKICKEMAGAFYEGAAHDNDFHKHYPEQAMFIEREWWRFLESARQSMWGIIRGERDLAMLASGLSRDAVEHAKEECLEILMRDKTIPKGGKMVTPSGFMSGQVGHA